MALQSDISSKAAELRDDAREAVKSKVSEGARQVQDEAVKRVSQVANAADAAGSEFDQNSLQAQAIDQFAQHVEGLANRVRGTDLNTITRDVSDFARKNPAIFIGGAALLGFAATRFLKARDPNPGQDHQAEADPWGTLSTVTGDTDVRS